MGTRSPLYAAHEAAGARFTEFGGWEMPVHYGSIRREHEAVRSAAGRFDVSHMGVLDLSGPDAEALVQWVTTRDLATLEPHGCRYTAMTDADGVMLEDAVVTRLPADGDPTYRLVVNAGMATPMRRRCVRHRDARGLAATVTDRTRSFGMIALQGPSAVAIGREVLGTAVGALDRFEATALSLGGVDLLVSRTGYTGEDGLELLVPWGETPAVWEALGDVQACGLGARDTLRLEAGLLLAGQDYDPEELPLTPLEAGIGFAVDLGADFVGRDALRDAEIERTRVGLRLLERGVPRHGHPIATPAGEAVGTVTSGTMSPTLGEPIAMGVVPPAHAAPGTELRVRIRDEPKKARVDALPFVDTGQ